MKKLMFFMIISGFFLGIGTLCFSAENTNKELQIKTMAKEYKIACEEGSDKTAIFIAGQLVMYGENAVPIFKKLLKTDRPVAIYSAVFGLGEVGGDNAVNVLREKYNILSNKYQKGHIIEALGKISSKGNKNAQDFLINIMQTEINDENIINAAIELHKSDRNLVAEKIILDNIIRYEKVIISIGKSVDKWGHRKKDIINGAIALLLNENVSRANWFQSINAAAEILRKTKYSETEEVLAKAYKIQTNDISKSQLIEVLGKIKSDKSRALLQEILNNKKSSSFLREQSRKALK